MTLHQEVGSNTDTTDADQKSPLTEKPKSAAPPMQIKRLKEHIDAQYPGFALPGEAAADTAIRIMQAQSATSAVPAHREVVQAFAPRCTTQYCNQPRDHMGEHGWVNFA